MEVLDLFVFFLTAVVSAGISAYVAVSGYKHVSKARRDFERDRTKFHEKLKAYKDLLESLDGVLMTFTSFKHFATHVWKTETPEELDESILNMVTILASMREREKVIGGDAIEKVIDWYNEKVGQVKGTEEESNEAAKEWLFESAVNFNLTLLRMLEHYQGRLIATLDTIDILAEQENVLKLARGVHTWLLQDAAELVTFMGRDSLPLIRQEEILVKLPQFDILAKQLRDAMRKDLDDTLRSEE